MTRAKAEKLREMILKAIKSLQDEDALECVELFPAWKAGVDYDSNVRVRYGEQLYRCEQTHTSQDNWTPDITPALWTEVAEPGEIPVWRQPTGAQDAYRIGDRVHYPDADGPVYVCTLDYNIYAPGVAGWEVDGS